MNATLPSPLRLNLPLIKFTDNGLCRALKNGNPSQASALLKKEVDLSFKDYQGNTALLLAVRKGYKKITQDLLEKGSWVNVQNKDKETPLIIAAKHGDNKLVKLLFKFGAQPNYSNTEGMTALMLAAKMGYLSTAKTIVQQRAYLYQLDQECADALSHARFYQNKKVSRYLKNLCPPLHAYSKELIARKWIAHLYEIEGMTYLHSPEQIAIRQQKGAIGLNQVPIEIELEGFRVSYIWHKITQGATLWAKKIPSKNSQQASLLIKEAGQLLIKRKFSAPQLLSLYKAKKPLIIPTGYNGHSVQVLFYDQFFILCNRGSASRKPIEVFRFCQSLLSEKIIDRLLDLRYERLKDYSDYLFNKLPLYLQLQQSNFERELEKTLSLPLQKVGNCSWASAEAAIYALLFLNLYLKKKEKAPPSFSHTTLKQRQLFKEWFLFQKAHALENYVCGHEKKSLYPYPTDFYLAKQSLDKLEMMAAHANTHPLIMKKIDSIRRFLS